MMKNKEIINLGSQNLINRMFRLRKQEIPDYAYAPRTVKISDKCVCYRGIR